MEDEEDEDSIFNVPHSLPSSAHATAVATRTPSGPPKVDASKYMPSYGGMLEIPGIQLRRNGLRDGIPFFPNPHLVWVHNSSRDHSVLNEPPGTDCLIATAYLHAHGDKYDRSFSLIRASSSTLNLDIVTSITCDRDPRDHIEFKTYAQVPYSYTIRGIKYCDRTSNNVVVIFREGIKIIQLNSDYKIPVEYHISGNDSETENDSEPSQEDAPGGGANIISHHSALKFVGSFPGQKRKPVIDAAMSRNQNILNVTCCDKREMHVKIYDLARPRRCLSIISKERDDEAKIKLSMNIDKKKTLRSFVPASQAFEEPHQIECNPSHLINSVLATSTKISQIDPRSNSIVENYADKFKLTNITPTEQFRRIVFSDRNDYQIYLLTNERLRVIDRRFRSKDMNILDHMLDSSTYNVMCMKLIESSDSNIETLCLSSYGRLCFISFDQGHHTHSLIESSGQLVNPMCTHQPLHEPDPIELSGRASDQLYGLAVSNSNIFDSNDVLFSTLQLSANGRVCIRGFPKSRERDMQVARLRSENFSSLDATLNQANPNIDPSEYRELGTDEDLDAEDEYIDLLDRRSISEAERKLTSKRAIAKYDTMKKLLRR